MIILQDRIAHPSLPEAPRAGRAGRSPQVEMSALVRAGRELCVQDGGAQHRTGEAAGKKFLSLLGAVPTRHWRVVSEARDEVETP